MAEAEIHALPTLVLYRGKWPNFCPGTLQPLPVTQQTGATDYLDVVKMGGMKSFGSSLKRPCFHVQGHSFITTLTDIPVPARS